MRRDLAVRGLLVVLATVVSATGISRPAATVLALLAVLAVTERLVRLRRRGRLDAALVGVGGLLVVLVLVGLLLDVVPGGLTRVSWSVGLGLVGLVALAVSAHRSAPPVIALSGRPRPAAAIRSMAWPLVALGVTVAAIVISVTSANDGEVQPLQLSAQDVTATGAQVVVHGGSTSGRYELLAGTGAGTSLHVLRPPFALAAGADLTMRVTLAPHTRMRIELATVSPRTSVRFVILDNTGG